MVIPTNAKNPAINQINTKSIKVNTLILLTGVKCEKTRGTKTSLGKKVAQVFKQPQSGLKKQKLIHVKIAQLATRQMSLLLV